MTDVPLPPPPPPDPVPGGASVPAADRPSWKQSALLFAAMAVIAGGSCAGFLANMNRDSAGVFVIGFLGALPIAGAAFTLMVFRLTGTASRDGWPSPLQCVLITAAGIVMALVGCGGFAGTMESVVPISVILFVVFIGGGLFGVGGLILLFSPVFRAIVGRKAPP